MNTRNAIIITGFGLLFTAALILLVSCTGNTSQFTPANGQSSSTQTTTTSVIPGLHPYIGDGTTLSNPSDPGPAQDPLSGTTIPTASTTTTTVLLGQDLFNVSCASCHGSPPRDALANKGDTAMLTAITQGQGQMPSFGTNLSKKQINSLVDYLDNAPIQIVIGPSYPHPTPAQACTSCHNGKPIVVPDAGTHAGITDTMCNTCHAPTLRQPPPIPHTQDVSSVCSDCHSPGGTAIFPSGHEKPGYSTCVFCHTQWTTPPSPDHETDGAQASCTGCHYAGSAMAPFPHGSGYEECALCHSY